MPSFQVRFKGMLTGQERERLTAAGIQLEGSRSSMTADPGTGPVPTGRPIYTVGVEAGSAEQALAEVREAIEPDTANFSNWEVEAL